MDMVTYALAVKKARKIIADLVGKAPENLDTLEELVQYMEDNGLGSLPEIKTAIETNNSIKSFDTPIKNYNQGELDHFNSGHSNFLTQVSNQQDFNIGDIGILKAKNAQTQNNVTFLNEIIDIAKGTDIVNLAIFPLINLDNISYTTLAEDCKWHVPCDNFDASMVTIKNAKGVFPHCLSENMICLDNTGFKNNNVFYYGYVRALLRTSLNIMQLENNHIYEFSCKYQGNNVARDTIFIACVDANGITHWINNNLVIEENYDSVTYDYNLKFTAPASGKIYIGLGDLNWIYQGKDHDRYFYSYFTDLKLIDTTASGIVTKTISYTEHIKVEQDHSQTNLNPLSGIATVSAISANIKNFNDNKIKYHKIRNEEANFELKKGHIYAFSVSNEDDNSAYIVGSKIEDLSTGATAPNTTIKGIAGKSLDSMNNGFVMMADRCAAGGLTGTISLLNSNAFVNDKWNYIGETTSDKGNNFKPPYYLKTITTDGIDIWEF